VKLYDNCTSLEIN